MISHRLARLLAWVRLSRRQIGLRLRPLRQFLLVLLRIWPITGVVGGLALCFVVPGLATDQTVEALLEYVRSGDKAYIVWSRYLLTVGCAIVLGKVLRHWSGKLLQSVATAALAYHLRYLPRVCRIIPTFAVAFAFLALQSGLPYSIYPYGLMGVGLLCVDWFQSRGDLLHRLRNSGRIAEIVAVIGARPVLYWLLFAFVPLGFVLSERDKILLLPFGSVIVAQALGPINILLLAFAVWTAILSPLIIISRKTRIPILPLLISLSVVISIFDLNDNHPIRRIPDTTVTTDDIRPLFLKWLSTRPDKEDFDDYPVIFVSAEGGGIRAGLFTAMTLARIADRCPRATNHIFAISGVSGGSVGAAIYAAAMKAKPPDTSDRRCDLKRPAPAIYENAMVEILTDDHLSPMLARLLFADAFQQFLPLPIDQFDRQLGLEYSLERSFYRLFGKDTLSESLYSLVPTENTPTVPYLLLNSTQVETGRRITMGPLYFRTDEFGGSDDWHAIDYLSGPPISAAAGTSARFPIISPPGYYQARDVVRIKDTVVPKQDWLGPKRRYVDGGYFDNSGTPTLMELYRALFALREQEFPLDEQAKPKTFSMRTLHIGNFPKCDAMAHGATCKEIKEQSGYSGILGELENLMQTVINVRDARVQYSLTQFKTEIERTSDLRPHGTVEIKHLDSTAQVQMHDQGTPVPLGWLLSQRAARELRSQIDADPEGLGCEANARVSNVCQLVNTVIGFGEKTP